jgi:hypothetical protein
MDSWFVHRWERVRGLVAEVIERVQAHYEVEEVEMGTVYRWCPESAVVDCGCGEVLTLGASASTCVECGANHAALVGEVLEARPVDKEVDHPWRLAHPYYRPTRGT